MRLPAGAVRAFDGATTLLIRCVGGSAWVTQEGNPGDVILSPGECFIAARTGKIVVQSLGGGSATVSAVECRR